MDPDVLTPLTPDERLLESRIGSIALRYFPPSRLEDALSAIGILISDLNDVGGLDGVPLTDAQIDQMVGNICEEMVAENPSCANKPKPKIGELPARQLSAAGYNFSR